MALPNELLESLEKAPGFNRPAFEAVHEHRAAITSLRFNPSKPIDHSKISFLDQPVPWSSGGHYLSQRPQFTFDPFIHAGAYYVQEASSMFLEQAVKQTCGPDPTINVLDLCAAPGGKSTLLQSILGEGSLLVSNEVIKARVQVLAENITKWGAVNCVVTNNDPKDFQKLPSFFDLLVVDAPCSGSGLFRRDPEATDEWSPGNVTMCSQRQQRILADVLPSLKENGILIYSTCSFSVEEDEAIADWLVMEQGMQPLKLEVDLNWNIVESQTSCGAIGYRFYPDKLKGEGFFISCFRKTGSSQTSVARGNKIEKATKAEVAIIEPYVEIQDLLIWKFGDRILSFPLQLEKDLGVLMAQLYIRKAGVSIGKIAGKDLIPDHELAMSTLKKASLPMVQLDKQTALQYLRREEFNAGNASKGWTLAGYENLALGWMKVLPNRINNYYPKEWRILKSSNN